MYRYIIIIIIIIIIINHHHHHPYTQHLYRAPNPEQFFGFSTLAPVISSTE
jgi:hypothetical protein